MFEKQKNIKKGSVIDYGKYHLINAKVDIRSTEWRVDRKKNDD